MTDAVCVIDAGTSGVRCGLVDPEGTVHASHNVALGVHYPEPGAAEQDPVEVWAATVAAVRGATSQAPQDLTVHAITISAQRASVAGLDSCGEAAFPFLLWMDQRGSTRLDELAAAVGAARFSALSGLPFGSMPALTRVLWLRWRHPDVFAATARLVGVQDWVTSQLTGASPTADASCAAWTGMYDLAARDWSRELVESVGLNRSLLPNVTTASNEVGRLTHWVGEATGLPAGLPVFAGGGDQQCSSVGAGAVTQTHATINLGTSATLLVPSRGHRYPGHGLVRGAHLIDDFTDLEGTVPAFGSALRWLATTLGYGDTDNGYRQLAAEVEQVPPGSDGLVFDPSFAGRGTPDWRPGAANVTGMQLSHSRSHLARAALEGLAAQIGDALSALARAGVCLDRVTLIGGGARSAVWNQLLADTTGTAVDTPAADPQQAPLRGAAMCAWVGLGRFTDLVEAADLAAAPGPTFTPAVPPRQPRTRALEDPQHRLDTIE